MRLGAVGVDGAGGKHPLGAIEGATENAAVAPALLGDARNGGSDARRIGTAITNTSAGSGREVARSLPRVVAARSSMSRSGSEKSGCPALTASTTCGLMSTPITSTPRLAKVAAVGKQI